MNNSTRPSGTRSKGPKADSTYPAALSCYALAFWFKRESRAVATPGFGQVKTSPTELVYPPTGIRVPPADGLQPEETGLYEEAAAVAPTSPRAASALLRVLLEAFLKRHLTTAGQSVGSENLYQLIDLTVTHLDLSPTMTTGLTAIRKRGNASVHDPYGLTDDEQCRRPPMAVSSDRRPGRRTPCQTSQVGRHSQHMIPTHQLIRPAAAQATPHPRLLHKPDRSLPMLGPTDGTHRVVPNTVKNRRS